MSELFHQLGIDVKLLAAQGVNFLIVLVVLMTFVYRPLIRLIKERRRTIEEGLENASRAEKRLAEAELEHGSIVAEAQSVGRKLVETAEDKAIVRSKEIVAEAAGKAFAEVERIRSAAAAQLAEEQTEAEQAVRKQAASLIVRGMEKLLREEVDGRKNEELIKKLLS